MHGKRLTARSVDAAKCQDKPYFLWDLDLKGFGLKVFPSGTKTFVVQYRSPNDGKSKRRSIGKLGSPWTAKDARDEASRILHVVGLGGDPVATAQTEIHSSQPAPFVDYANLFLSKYAALNWSERTTKTHQSNIERWLVPVIGKTRIDNITRSNITEVLDQVEPGKPALPRNLFVLMRTIFNWAVDRGDLQKSPMAGMKPPRPPAERHHILSDDEIIVVALAALKMGPIWGGMIHMLLLTGQRLREVSEAEWSEFDRETELWKIPGGRTKNGREQVVPLNLAARTTLDELAGNLVWPKTGFVFTHKPGRPVSGYSRMKRRLDGVIAKIEPSVRPWRLHDLRRTVATNMQRLGVRFEVTEAILNHVSTTQAGVASVYQRHDWAQEKRDALNAWGAKLMDALSSWSSTQNVSGDPTAASSS